MEGHYHVCLDLQEFNWDQHTLTIYKRSVGENLLDAAVVWYFPSSKSTAGPRPKYPSASKSLNVEVLRSQLRIFNLPGASLTKSVVKAIHSIGYTEIGVWNMDVAETDSILPNLGVDTCVAIRNTMF